MQNQRLRSEIFTGQIFNFYLLETNFYEFKKLETNEMKKEKKERNIWKQSVDNRNKSLQFGFKLVQKMKEKEPLQ